MDYNLAPCQHLKCGGNRSKTIDLYALLCCSSLENEKQSICYIKQRVENDIK